MSDRLMSGFTFKFIVIFTCPSRPETRDVDDRAPLQGGKVPRWSPGAYVGWDSTTSLAFKPSLMTRSTVWSFLYQRINILHQRDDPHPEHGHLERQVLLENLGVRVVDRP
jgi:hypothetical protein